MTKSKKPKTETPANPQPFSFISPAKEEFETIGSDLIGKIKVRRINGLMAQETKEMLELRVKLKAEKGIDLSKGLNEDEVTVVAPLVAAILIRGRLDPDFTDEQAYKLTQEHQLGLCTFLMSEANASTSGGANPKKLTKQRLISS
jgi:hypothetical protein